MSKSALILLDLQNGILSQLMDQDPDYLTKIATVASAARSAGLPVIYVHTGFRPGYSDVSPKNLGFARVAASGSFILGDASTDFPHSITPQENDIVVVKRRISAFAGTDLQVVLNGQGVDSLVICGLSTSGAVLSTTRQAADLDYVLTLLADLCLDKDANVQKVVIDDILSRQATITTADEWAAQTEEIKET
jgi:nicotinamidase-related amidase